MLKQGFFLTVLFILLGCGTPEVSPQLGPNGSFWVGGADGGVYIFIEDDENKTDDMYQGVIYYEADQSVWYSGKFKYNKSDILKTSDRSIYDGWDGEKLFLKDGSYLSAINPPD